jgi:hypothetical protein
MMAGFSVDVSQIAILTNLLALAAEKPKAQVTRLHREIGAQVASEARANASSWFTKDSTGETAGSITVSAGADRALISAGTRGAHFNEYGSPNTGGPRPFMSQPAEEGARRLGIELFKVAGPW